MPITAQVPQLPARRGQPHQAETSSIQSPLDSQFDTGYHPQAPVETSSGISQALSAVCTPTELKENYKRLGDIRLDNNQRQEVFIFWRKLGYLGMQWLLQQIRSETDVETLAGVSSALSRMGEGVLPLLVTNLAGKAGRVSPEMAETLIQALMRIPIRPGNQLYAVIPDLLSRFFESPDIGVRQTAYSALACLTPGKARELLPEAQRREHDPEAQELIAELLNDLAE